MSALDTTLHSSGTFRVTCEALSAELSIPLCHGTVPGKQDVFRRKTEGDSSGRYIARTSLKYFMNARDDRGGCILLRGFRRSQEGKRKWYGMRIKSTPGGARLRINGCHWKDQ